MTRLRQVGFVSDPVSDLSAGQPEQPAHSNKTHNRAPADEGLGTPGMHVCPVGLPAISTLQATFTVRACIACSYVRRPADKNSKLNK